MSANRCADATLTVNVQEDDCGHPVAQHRDVRLQRIATTSAPVILESLGAKACGQQHRVESMFFRACFGLRRHFRQRRGVHLRGHTRDYRIGTARVYRFGDGTPTERAESAAHSS